MVAISIIMGDQFVRLVMNLECLQCYIVKRLVRVLQHDRDYFIDQFLLLKVVQSMMIAKYEER